MTGLKPKRKYNYLYFFIGLILCGLIGVQIYWITNNIKLQNIALDRALQEDMHEVAADVEDNAYCFDLMSRAYIKRGEGLYIIKQTYEDGAFIPPSRGGTIDTLDMFNAFFMEKDTMFYNERTLVSTQYPLTLDASFKFTFYGANPKVKGSDSTYYMLTGLNEKNFLQKLTSSFNIVDVIDTGFLKEQVQEMLNKHHITGDYTVGIRKQGSSDYEYVSGPGNVASLDKSDAKTEFLRNKFDVPYEIVLSISDSFSHIMRSMSVMMISSILIIIILVVSYAYFISTIINERRLSSMKDNFISNITHEFRTPITNIALAIENWKDAGKNESFYFNIIEEENQHLDRNVDQVLQLTTMEQNTYRNGYSNVDMHEVIRSAADSFKMQLQNVEGRVAFELNATNPVVHANKVEMKNMVCNLLDNAIKYKNGPPHIRVSTKDMNGDRIAIMVEDNGIGMSSETQEYIFDRFYRYTSGDRHDVKGFGLGLSYVKYIVEEHKGEVNVKSKPGKGSVFTIILPKKKRK